MSAPTTRCPQSPEAAKPRLDLASSPESEGVTGRYFAKEKPISSTKPTHDEAAARRPWDLSEELTGLKVTA